MLVYLQVMEAPANKGKFERLYAQYQGLMYHIAYDILRKWEQRAKERPGK